MALHRQGDLAAAERFYGELLDQEPHHFDALHMLGVVALQARRTERGVELIRKTIGINRKVAAAHNLPELIATTLDDYERLPIQLVTNPQKLTDIGARLADNRLTKPLFDTELFTRHIEAAYTTMHARHQAGLAPDHIAVSNSFDAK